jgi:hypothetical protein
VRVPPGPRRIRSRTHVAPTCQTDRGRPQPRPPVIRRNVRKGSAALGAETPRQAERELARRPLDMGQREPWGNSSPARVGRAWSFRQPRHGGGRITPDRRPIPARLGTAGGTARDHPVPLGAVSERRRDTPRIDPEAARRSLTSVYRILKDIEKTMESVETPTSDGNIARRVFNRFTSGRRVRTEMAELHRTLDLARKEASKAASLDPDSIIDTDDGPLKVRALLSLADRVEGAISFPASPAMPFPISIVNPKLCDAGCAFHMAPLMNALPTGQALCAYARCSTRRK